MRQRLPGRTAGWLLHRELWMHGLQFVLYEGSVIIGAVASLAQARRDTFAKPQVSDRDAEHGDLS